MTRVRDEIEYSAKVPGDCGNYRWPVRMDDSDGYLGIVQTRDGDTVRVLLSPKQVEALIAFYRTWHSPGARTR